MPGDIPPGMHYNDVIGWYYPTSPYLDSPAREAIVESWLLDYQAGKVHHGDCWQIVQNIIAAAKHKEG